jgi:hypothetical protein
MKKYGLFDGRWLTDEDAAVCFEFCDTIEEARENRLEYGEDTVIVEFDVENRILKNGTVVQ